MIDLVLTDDEVVLITEYSRKAERRALVLKFQPPALQLCGISAALELHENCQRHRRYTLARAEPGEDTPPGRPGCVRFQGANMDFSWRGPMPEMAPLAGARSTPVTR